MQSYQTTTKSEKRWNRVGSALLAGALLAFTAGKTQAGQGWLYGGKGLVPYQGIVEGQLMLDGMLNVVEAPPASVWSHPFGPGQQFYDLDTMQVAPIFDEQGNLVGLVTSGTARTVMRNGDELRLSFYLESTFVSPTELVYEGTYTILPGGTGRFEYADADPDHLGSGDIMGSASLAVDPATGIYTMSFFHGFMGDVLMERRAPLGGFPRCW